MSVGHWATRFWHTRWWHPRYWIDAIVAVDYPIEVNGTSVLGNSVTLQSTLPNSVSGVTTLGNTVTLQSVLE